MVFRTDRAMATKPPTTAPMPSTESMSPTPAGPVSRMSTAKTTPRTTMAPETVIWTQMSTMTMTRLPSRAMVV